MKFAVISPKNGSVRISRFTTINFDAARNVENENEAAGRELCCDLERRSTAPLELSAALRAQLPRQRSQLQLERRN